MTQQNDPRTSEEDDMAQPLIVRESDGLQFEPTVQPGMVRCECCLQLVEPARVREHKCLHLYYELTELWPGMAWDEGLAAFHRIVRE